MTSFSASPGDARTIEIPVVPQQPEGYPGNPSSLITPLLQDFTTLRLRQGEQGSYDLTLGPALDGPQVKQIDFRALVPRIPAIAKGNDDLTRLALFQREFNRNDTKLGPVAGFDEMKIANNCLRAGLWEVMLEKKTEAGTGMVFHGWFTLPESEYAAMFEAANGIALGKYKELLFRYPEMDGLSVPLKRLRKVTSETSTHDIATHASENVTRLGEQARKAGLLLSDGIELARDFTESPRQPIALASFQEPGRYDREKPVSFDLAWLGQPKQLDWRRVSAVADKTSLEEIEIGFASGHRLLVADRDLAHLPVLAATPTKEAEVRKLTFGIGTPEIYASMAERKAELESPRADYLLLLDEAGKLVDNHKAGIDRAYLWREAGNPGRLHVMLVSYERIAIVAHYSVSWQPPAESSIARLVPSYD